MEAHNNADLFRTNLFTVKTRSQTQRAITLLLLLLGEPRDKAESLAKDSLQHDKRLQRGATAHRMVCLPTLWNGEMVDSENAER